MGQKISFASHQQGKTKAYRRKLESEDNVKRVQ